MRACVLLKQVPDTSVRLQVSPGGLEPRASGYLPVVNPYDEFALEAALRLREAAGGGEVVLVTLSREPAEESVFHGLAMGADRAVTAALAAAGPPTPRQAAGALAALLRDLAPDLVCCGERAVDDEAAQVGPLVAQALGWPQACGVESAQLESGGRTLRLRCRRGGSLHVLTCPLPCVAAFLRGPQLPRYPSMADIFAVKSKPVTQAASAVSDETGGLRRLRLWQPSEERARQMIPAGPGAAEALLSEITRAVSWEH